MLEAEMTSDAKPPSCSLTAEDHTARVAWIDELNADALRAYRRDGRRIELVYSALAAARVRDLVRRETKCCPFLGFTIREEGDASVLVIEAPEDAGAAADALFAPYLP